MKTFHLPDIVLLNRFRSGDHAAFDAFYAMYWKPLYNTAYRILKDTPAAEDIVQETFVLLWEHRKKINHDNIGGWLSVTSYRLVLKALKQQQRLVHLEHATINEPIATPADQLLLLRQLEYRINYCVERLPEQCQKVYKLSREEELPVKGIAAKLGISPKTVEAHVTAAMKKLRKGLECIAITCFFIS